MDMSTEELALRALVSYLVDDLEKICGELGVEWVDDGSLPTESILSEIHKLKAERIDTAKHYITMLDAICTALEVEWWDGDVPLDGILKEINSLKHKETT